MAKFNPKRYGEYRAPEEKIDVTIIDVEVRHKMDQAIKSLEMLRVAE